jgi:hypothetical protein
MIHIYTSQSKRYFDSIGKYSLASVLKYLPKNSRITVTTEDFDTFPKLDSRITVVDLYALNNGFREFQDRWTGKTMAKVINFAKKGYTVMHAAETCKEDLIVWLDADAHIVQHLSEDWLNKLQDNRLGAHMGVTHDSGEFTIESGFFLLNPRHAGIADFARLYRDYYDNDRCENMGRFYDGNVHGHVIKDCEKLGHTFVEMNLRQKGNTPLKGSMIHGYVGHFKGKSKNEAEPFYRALGLDGEAVTA